MARVLVAVGVTVVFLLAAQLLPARRDAGAQNASPSAGEAAPRRSPTTRPRGSGLTEEQEQKLLAFLKEKRPHLHSRLVELQERSPRSYRYNLNSAWRWYRQWEFMPPDVQEAALAEENNRVLIFRTVQALRETEDPRERKKLHSQLRKAVAEHFHAEQKMREYWIGQLEERIRRLRKEHEQRAHDRNKIVSERYGAHLKASTQPAPKRRGPAESRRRRRPDNTGQDPTTKPAE